MRLMPIVYVTDIAKALDFYTALGLQGSKHSAMWAELSLGDASLALHYTNKLPEKQIGRVELAMVAPAPLETLVERLKAAGVPFEARHHRRGIRALDTGARPGRADHPDQRARS